MDASDMLSRLACPLIPVVVIDRLDDAVPLAEALLQGGISALEITLRTPVACEAISAMKSAISLSARPCVGSSRISRRGLWLSPIAISRSR